MIPANLPRPTLAILDQSNGPSGLSRYLDILWPALQSTFRIVVIGNPWSPYKKWPLDEFITFGNAPVIEQATPPPGATIARAHRNWRNHLWRNIVPTKIKSTVGHVRDALKLQRILERVSPDVIYLPICHIETTATAVRLAGMSNAVGTLHHLPPPNPILGYDRLMLGSSLKSLRRMIAVSEQVGRGWAKVVPQLASKIQVIRNGVPLPDETAIDRAKIREEFKLPVNGQLWLAAGRMTWHKGFEHLIDAAAVLSKNCSNLTIAIAGEGPLERALVEQVSRLQLDRVVRFLGHVSNMDQLYRAADGFVLSSVSEAIGYVLLEAMSYGLPVVATAVGGVPELVKDGVNGKLVPPGNPTALGAAVAELIGNPQLAAQYGESARRDIAANWNVEQMREQTIRVLLNARRKSSPKPSEQL